MHLHSSYEKVKRTKPLGRDPWKNIEYTIYETLCHIAVRLCVIIQAWGWEIIACTVVVSSFIKKAAHCTRTAKWFTLLELGRNVIYEWKPWRLLVYISSVHFSNSRCKGKSVERKSFLTVRQARTDREGCSSCAICFPELCRSPHSNDDVWFAMSFSSEALNRQYHQWLKQLTRVTKITRWPLLVSCWRRSDV